MFKRKKVYIIPIVGFALIMLIGGILLHLPICNKGNIKFIDNLFTSVSAITTTGFSIKNVSENYTFVAQIIIAILMNIGAVGFISLIAAIWKVQNKKIALSNMDVINESIGNKSYFGIKEEVVRVLKCVLLIESIGAILYSAKFIPQYGMAKGIWYSIFHSISAFSNSGFDLFGNNGFTVYSNNSYIQIVTTIIMILGAIGVFPIYDIIRNKKRFSKLKLQTKIVLMYSAILIVISLIGIKIFEGNNISWLNALFMGTTTRSTGLYTVNVFNMSVASKLFILILMFIGGAPSSTAGGIRVVVFAVIEAVVLTTLKGKKEVVIFWRKIDEDTIRMSITILIMFVTIVLIATVILVCINNFGLFDILFTCISAISTTGLTTVNLEILNTIAKIIVMILMYIGRLGPLSIVMLLLPEKKTKTTGEYPEEELIL